VVTFQEYFDETQRLEYHIENNTVPHIYDAMQATHHRELDNYQDPALRVGGAGSMSSTLCQTGDSGEELLHEMFTHPWRHFGA